MTELLVISAAGSLSVRPLPITFFRPISAHKQAQMEQAMRGVVFAGERELEPMQFPDPAPHAHDVVIEMEASGLCGGTCINTAAGRHSGARAERANPESRANNFWIPGLRCAHPGMTKISKGSTHRES
ncbi:hypothetical protein KMZ68_25330 [Bradyrhizobium sediminis]|uniref:Uncharacterized protein n=1 Tax=Bradyrhizobium sediminis TaxID=2840469 RepID=A0A975NPD1_9BRAD|nr:hypothetical protein [Bradyrhizobium sediminis]QWG18216.1 hypothetical protein KMZ68_25330 [Bradyrhizobium sediminis]